MPHSPPHEETDLSLPPVEGELAEALRRHPLLQPRYHRYPEGAGDDWSLALARDLEGASPSAIALRLRAMVATLADPKLSGYQHLERCMARIMQFHERIQQTEPGEWADRHPWSAAVTFAWYTGAELVAMLRGSTLLGQKFVAHVSSKAGRSEHD